MKDSKNKKRQSKWDWAALKAEFLAGDWKSASSFLREKNIPEGNFAQTTGWAKEKKELKDKSIELTKNKIVEQESDNIVEVRKRQARLARFMQLKGAKVLENMSPETVDEARRLVHTGMREERAILGLDQSSRQSLTQINIQTPKTNLDRMVEGLDYEGVLKLIAELRRERIERSRRAASESSVDEAEEGEAV